MYKHFFGLRENPFNVNPDPRYLFLTPQTQEALDKLTYGIQARKGLILLTGEVGTGKTTLINRLLEWLHQQQTPTAFVFNSCLEKRHLFDFILADFGVPFDSRTGSNSLIRLNQWLLERYGAEDNPVLIVDEAQGLSFELLEEIRLLQNLETPHEKLLQIVLVGQPELEEKLKRHELRQLRQRIALRCKTAPFTAEETHGYIQARLHIAGANGKPVFTAEAINAVYFYSQGIPRVMNLLCEHSLINSYADDIQPVPAHIVVEAAREFQFDGIRPFIAPADSGNAAGTDWIPMQPILVKAPSPPPPAAEPALEEQSNAEMTRPSVPFVVAKPVARPDCVPSAQSLSCERTSAFIGHSQIITLSTAPARLFGLTEAEQEEAGQFPDLDALTSETAFQLLSAIAAKLPAIASAPRLHPVEANRDFVLPAASRRSSVPRLEMSSRHAITGGSTAQSPRSSSRTHILFLRHWRTRWIAGSRARWLAMVASSRVGQITTTLRHWVKQGLRQATNPVQLICRRWPPWWDGSFSTAQSRTWSRRAASLIQWLQQPVAQDRWRLLDSRQAQVRGKLSQRKI